MYFRLQIKSSKAQTISLNVSSPSNSHLIISIYYTIFLLVIVMIILQYASFSSIKTYDNYLSMESLCSLILVHFTTYVAICSNC